MTIFIFDLTSAFVYVYLWVNCGLHSFAVGLKPSWIFRSGSRSRSKSRCVSTCPRNNNQNSEASTMPSHICHKKRQVYPKKSLLLFDYVNTVVYEPIHSSSDGQIETQFKNWVDSWDKRVFQEELAASNQASFFYNEQEHNRINKLVDDYHAASSEQVAKDRFVWTCFACAIIKEHRQKLELRQGYGHETIQKTSRKCRLHCCFYILLWISFHLRLPVTDLVGEILTEILICTKSLRFMFSFLPSISLRLYTTLMWSNPPTYEDKLCNEFFYLFDVNMVPRPLYKNAFKLARPMLIYLVHHLSPLHRDHNRHKRSFTLAKVINKPILFGRKFCLLYIGVHFHDEELIEAVIARGACANKHYWDALLESSISAEKCMISSVNAIMGTQQFLAGLLSQPSKFMNCDIEKITRYASILRRSVFCSQIKRSSDKWSSDDSLYELNCQIADAWGIGCKAYFPTLQHICKIVIREQILRADNTLLPKAAHSLPLPKKLIRYINLELD
ncbi:hypothetical protein PoB_007496700 [Plakobranchus ocellatus]|uniref:SOCS box domain-containing protein n=1 Tax=Plakobranchus ocellatus TaxID=259542 RepID=A0AAV4DVY3_9GAST|nr:hypothetical protein PoB_007496700 [Plakobranchus ocellatus]